MCTTSSLNSTIYRSDVFQVAPRTSPGAISSAWDAHVRQTYHLKPSEFLNPGCLDLLTDPTGQRSITGLEQVARAHKSQLIHVAWKYTPGQDLPAPTPVASGKGKPCYCYAFSDMNGKNLYLSDIFEMPPGTPTRPVMDDFVYFVRDKFGLQDKGRWDCSYEDKSKGANSMKGAYKIVETGWKPKKFPPPATH
jgi:hypothetical protein